MSEAQTWLSCACIPDPDTREQPSHPALLQRFPAFSSQCPFSWWPRKHFSFKFHSWRFYYVHPIPRQCLSFHHSLSFSCHPGSCSTVMNFFSFSHLLIRWDFASFSAHFAHLECISYLKPHSTRKDIVKYPPLPHWSLSFMLPSLNFLWTLDLEGFFFLHSIPIKGTEALPYLMHWPKRGFRELLEHLFQKTGWILNVKQGKVRIET